jgi:hypothetical protein
MNRQAICIFLLALVIIKVIFIKSTDGGLVWFGFFIAGD